VSDASGAGIGWGRWHYLWWLIVLLCKEKESSHEMVGRMGLMPKVEVHARDMVGAMGFGN